MSGWSERKPNPQFPHCAQVARKMLAEVYGCKPGDEIPPESVLLEAARAAAASERYDLAKDREVMALGMLDEIGGL